MKDEIKLKLLELIEVQAIGILLEKEIVSYIKPPSQKTRKENSHTFRNIKLNSKYRVLFDMDQTVDDAFVAKYRALFPNYKTRRGTPNIVKNKLIRFITNEGSNYTLDEIYECTKRYVDETMANSEPQMVRGANNIIYKQVTGGEDMLLLNLLEEYEDVLDMEILKKKMLTYNLDDNDNTEETEYSEFDSF